MSSSDPKPPSGPMPVAAFLMMMQSGGKNRWVREDEGLERAVRRLYASPRFRSNHLTPKRGEQQPFITDPLSAVPGK